MAEPTTWPPVSPLSGRESDVEHLRAAAAEGHCTSLVGMSNIGKSYVLRALCKGVQQEALPPPAFVYIDCNRMVESTDQGFYELVLRCLRASLMPTHGDGHLADQLEQCYGDVVSPASPFLAPLRFSEGISAVCEQLARPLVLIFDEFDEVMQRIDDRVLLNLRALRDTYSERLSYITASGRRLSAIRRTHGSGEFAELFGQNIYFLGPLHAEAASALVGQWVAGEGLALTPADMPFILEESGGHPALLEAVARALSALHQDARAIQRTLSTERIRERLDTDVACHAECTKFWQELDALERHALLEVNPPEEGSPHAAAWQALLERHLLCPAETGAQPFCRLFAAYLRRQRLLQRPDSWGVRVDVEAGDVWVDGRQISPLTDLEYRLLLLLYGHLDKIVDKYTVVEAVWGQDYIDQVDDARIEKLMSRLRQKLEANPAEPRYLLTVRGRGYKLVSP